MLKLNALSLRFSLCLVFGFLTMSGYGQSKESLDSEIFNDLKFRSIGPAFMSGRIADIAIHPENDNIWYVAVGSGGLWKTVNAGITWRPIFDNQKVYSTGCVTIDPNNPERIWLGTGENVGGRHVGWGDGIYLSEDGGATWKNMGLKNSEHLSKIIVHPKSSDTLWVASQGPLWSKGGDRGLYMSADGGLTWKRKLGDEEWTGCTDIVIDPENPNNLYAATWQRHRTVAAYMGGGPKTAIYRSKDGGKSWDKLEKGLPTSNMGKIGLAISPQNSNVLYAAIELDRRTGGFYKSENKGSSWSKMSDAVSSATGPHYYQELYACPHNEGRVYLADSRLQVTDDGGKTFRRVKNEHKHVDNHALAFRKDDPNYLLIGTDGGLYESFDLAENWRFINNMPITQFYKLAVDDTKPFYNVYGGTQDNSTEGGPSRTDNIHGIQNSDWRVVLNWDGHQPAVEPGNPNIVYGQRQEGTLSRIDIATGEVVDIQPQPEKGAEHERFNWDAPILISPHSPSTIYFASYRLWKSTDRGDSWTAISKDLTRNEDRMNMPLMGKKQGWNNSWDFLAMSQYNTITSISESPVKKGLIFIGTDDGLIHVRDGEEAEWKKIEVGSLLKVNERAYINDIKCDLHDENTVYLALDGHKYGEFESLLFKSSDKGKSWKKITDGIIKENIVWRIVQDHVNPNLLFAGTEWGIYFSSDKGNHWTQLKGGVPTIAFRDLAIQKDHDDLVAASFGRGFYILDDYSALRKVNSEELEKEMTLYKPRDAWWYIERPQLSFVKGKGSQGAAHFLAPNPDFGATFTYFVKTDFLSQKEQRAKLEKKSSAENIDISFPGWQEIESEKYESPEKIWFMVTNGSGEIVRKIEGVNKKGIHRVTWDLRYPSKSPIVVGAKTSQGGWQPKGFLVAPGEYSVEMFKEDAGVLTSVSDPQKFQVKPLLKGSLEGPEMKDVMSFWREFENSRAKYSELNNKLNKSLETIDSAELALKRSNAADDELFQTIRSLKSETLKLKASYFGFDAKNEVGLPNSPNPGSRLYTISRIVENSTYGPTQTATDQLEIINEDLAKFADELKNVEVKMQDVKSKLNKYGAPIILK